MPERYPSSPKPASQESAARGLRNGAPDAIERLNAFIDAEEARVERGEITNIQKNINWAEAYLAAGPEFFSYAREAFQDALAEAYQTSNDDVVAYCEQELAKFP